MVQRLGNRDAVVGRVAKGMKVSLEGEGEKKECGGDIGDKKGVEGSVSGQRR